jgi:radical SAM superfamily enzyme YgiQ (UPF0313 family)
VFGPYAQDDEYGSRTMNPMELYHNQVTRVQGAFSLRKFHRSWGLMLIQANLRAPCTLLDFPTLDRFVEEIRDNPYDIVGISSIITNWLKVRKMCQLVRQHLPDATIVVGGHIANMPDLAERIDADHLVRGEGVAWFRNFLGEPADGPLRHPQVRSAFGTRSMGVDLAVSNATSALVIPSVGCPLGCNFCSTSAMFGGKGKFVDFYESGDELFDIMCQLETSLEIESFFVMDENFLLHRRRALRLLELMERHDKSWSLNVFSSANALRRYSFEQLLGLGISGVWMGLEGADSQYGKLHGTDLYELVEQLQSHGINVLGSTIIGMEDHTPENIDAVIDDAVRYNADFHQFMLYTPIPGTPLHADLSAAGRMKDESEYEVGDIHGQYIFNYRHPHIPTGQEAEMLLRAFQRDFAVNGPSIARFVRTALAGWQRHKQHPNPRVRRRYASESRSLATTFPAVVWAMKWHYRGDPRMRANMAGILRDLVREFGWRARSVAALGGPYLAWKVWREQKRLAGGWTYEPATFYEGNEAARAADARGVSRVEPCRYVIPRVGPSPAAARPAPLPTTQRREQKPRPVPAGSATRSR